MSNAIKVLPYYTYDEYCKWEGRWELIEGLPFAMSPAPAPKHQLIAVEIKYEFNKAIKNKKCNHCRVYDFIDVKVEDDTILQPDALIVCNEIKKPYLDFPPTLVVEVLSASTALKDRNNKFYIYQDFKIPYYLMVDPNKQEIEVFHLNNNGKYQLMENEANNLFSFDLHEECSVEVELGGIFG